MKGKLFKLVTALLFNVVMGAIIASLLDIHPLWGIATALTISIGLPLLGVKFIPEGVLQAGILTEVWTGELIKALRASDTAPWLDGVPDYSQYAENDVIHMIDVGGDPDVLVNNTTYPIAIQTITDSDAVFSLDKFQTKATPVTDDELYATSYDKMTSLKERHASKISESKFQKAIHALAPDENDTLTPVLETTGEIVDGGTSGRRRLQRSDIVRLKAEFDAMEIPIAGRRLVLCSDHVNDLLLVDQAFRDQYYNYTTGKISNIYGFEVYEYVANPTYKTTGEKVAYGATAGTNEFQASVAFYKDRVFKASGSTKMYYSEASTDPEYQRNLVNFRHYFIVLPKKAEAMGAIRSGYVAPTVVE